MSEIERDLIYLEDHNKEDWSPDDLVITAEHTYADILRYIIDGEGIEGVQALLDIEKEKRGY